MSLRIGSIGIDTNDLEAATAFWTAVTGYKVEAHEDSYAVLSDPNGRDVGIGIHLVPEPRVGKNRLHFDLFVDDIEAEAARLEALGAVRVARHGEGDGGWIVYEDNEGNQFCIAKV